MRGVAVSFLVPLLAACTTTVTAPEWNRPDGALPTDSAAPDGGPLDAGGPDEGAPDGSPPVDVLFDGGFPGDGGGFDLQPPRDLPDPPWDLPDPLDTGRPRPDSGDPPSFPLVDRWRVAAYLGRGSDGRVISLTDRNTPYTDPETGTTTPVRANGVLTLTRDRFALSFGTLASDHFYIADQTRPLSEGYSAAGYTAPGILDEATGEFTIPGGTVLSLRRGRDGTITYTDSTEGAAVVFERAPTVTALPTLNAVGYAQLHRPGISAPMAHPRVALLWDRPGGGSHLESHGYALRFTGPYAGYPLVLGGPPEVDVRATVGGVPVALAFLVVYDDVNNNARLEAPPDVGRGFSPIALVWRGAGTPEREFTTSIFRDCQPGYQLVHLRQDASTGSLGVMPFDTAVPVSPDVPVSTAALTGAVPHLLR